MKVAILGGSGKLGLGFVSRLSQSAHEIAIGSRDPLKARQTVSPTVQALSNEEAAIWSDLCILTIPYSAHRATIERLKTRFSQKVVIDATVPLDPNNILRIATESGKSAAEETYDLIGGGFVYAAFQTISHRILKRHDVQEDVLVAGSDERKTEVMQLIHDMNLRPIDAGPLEAAALLERMTPLLLSINKQNRIKDAGLKVTGIQE